MKNLKQCPQCNKELPVTASNCKFCGASLGEEHRPSLFDSLEDSGLLKGHSPAVTPIPAPPAPPAPPAAPRITVPIAPPAPPSAPRVSMPMAPPAPPAALRVSVPVAPPAPPVAVSPPPKDTATDDWIPDTEASDLIDLDEVSGARIPLPAAELPESPLPATFQEELEPGSNDKTVVTRMPEQYLAAMAEEGAVRDDMKRRKEDSGLMELTSSMEVSAPTGEPKEISGLLDLDNLEPVDDEERPAASLPDPSGAAPVMAVVTPIAARSPMKTMLGIPSLVPPEPPVAPVPASAPVPVPVPVPVVPAPVVPAPVPEIFAPVPAPVPVPVVPAPTPSSAPARVVPSSTLSSRDDEVQDECTARIDPEAIRRKYKKPAGFGTRLQTTWQSMNHTKRSVLIGVVAFVLTLVIAFTVMWILSAPDDVPAGPTVVETTIAAPAEKPVPEVEARPVSPIGDPGRSCTPLGRYDRTFPFREVLVRTGAALSVNNVCGFFGTSPAAIAKVFRSDQVVGPTGDDWVAEGGQLEIYPSGTVGEKEPSIQFLFVKDHLVRVRLRLRDAKAGNRLTVARLQKFLRMLDSRTDHLGRRITTLRDQDLNVLYAEEDWYGQVLKTLEFSSVQVDETLADVFASARELETAWKAAETAYFAWKFDEAMAGYDKVLSLSEGVGMAHVKRGLIALRDDDFGKTAELAARALEVTRDNGVKAEAYGLQAVIALRNDARGEALELLKKAAALAPAAERFRTGVAQLETGEYAEAHVAQTAARLACIKQGKSRASELGVLARGLFPDMKTYNRALAAVSRSRQFRSTRDNYMQWECR